MRRLEKRLFLDQMLLVAAVGGTRGLLRRFLALPGLFGLVRNKRKRKECSLAMAQRSVMYAKLTTRASHYVSWKIPKEGERVSHGREEEDLMERPT